MLDKQMFRWKMKIFSYTSFCWILNIVLSDTLSDEELSFVCTSFLFLFLVSNMSLKSFGTLSNANHSSGNSITHLTVYFLASPSFLFEYRIVCMTLSLESYKQNGKWARQWGHMKSEREIGNEKILLIPQPNACLPSLASFSCQIFYDVRCYVAFRLPTIFIVAHPSDQVLLLTIWLKLGMKDSLNWMLLLHLVWFLFLALDRHRFIFFIIITCGLFQTGGSLCEDGSKK